MSTDLEKEIKEIQLDDLDAEKKVENQINSKIAKRKIYPNYLAKRNPLEKIIDDSIIICDEIIEKVRDILIVRTNQKQTWTNC